MTFGFLRNLFSMAQTNKGSITSSKTIDCVNGLDQVPNSVQIQPTTRSQTLSAHETREMLQICINCLHKYRLSRWQKDVKAEVCALKRSLLPSYRCAAAVPIARLIYEQLPSFWAQWLDGLSRADDPYDFDAINEARFLGLSLWGEGDDNEDDEDDNWIFDFPYENTLEAIVTYANRLSELRPDLDWNTHTLDRSYPRREDFYLMMSSEVQALEELGDMMNDFLLKPYFEEARLEEIYEQDFSSDIQEVLNAVEEHGAELFGEFRRGLVPAKYGMVDTSRARRSVDEFVKIIGIEKELRVLRHYQVVDEVFRLLMERASAISEKSETVPSDPYEFEVWCLKAAHEIGCEGNLTRSSGDQGVDIVLSRNGISLAVQCKRYSRPCGNSVVQEVKAGQFYYQLDKAVVVSTAGFTRSAEELAMSCDVVLCLASDFKEILLGLTGGPA